MKLALAYLFYLSISLVKCQTNEALIRSVVFKNYDKTIRPSDYVEIRVKQTLKQIVSLDEKSQIVTTSSFLFVYWIDQRLTWDPRNFSNISSVIIPLKSVWLPDLYVINTADTNGYLTISDSAYAYLYWFGGVTFNLGLIGLKTRCAVNVYKFPYDKQMCSIIIGSWFTDSSSIRIILEENSEKLPNILEYTKNPIWDLKNTSAELINTGSRLYYLGSNYDFYFNFTIARQPLYYMINNVYPCLILNVVTLITYFFPFNTQAILAITTFLNLAIISVRVSNDVPVQSEYMPLISLYFLLNLLFTFLAFLWFSVAETVKTTTFQTKRLPSLIRMDKLKLIKVKSKEEGDDTKSCSYQIDITFLNRINFIIMFLLMLVTYLVIWLTISN